ncbi:winged helix-turn-helix domain-containing tetratricopeptide repeat protein [Reyranella sp.]|uniref:winged helix-turn-helix domain-containing tetratricopeptide repeat protein n=1 Tax=Reyranella sp. TaxID=1929291 RepID=UPI003785016E
MLFHFSDHVLDIVRRELTRGAERLEIEPQVFDLLAFLVQNRDRVVSKDDLIAAIWQGRVVSESTLTSRINAARKAVGDNGQDQRLIRTLARKGFRFVGVVAESAESVPAPATSVSVFAAAAAPAHPAPLDRPGIAVLPFVNMSGEPEQEYFSDGISEDVITALSRLRWVYVIARNSSFVYKDRAVHLARIGSELGVGYVVQGSVRKAGDRVRITAQLNAVATGSHIWAERYDRALADVFAVQDEISQAIVAAIEPQLYAAESSHARRSTPDSLDAWDLVMRALTHYWRVTRQDNVVAQALLEKAISIDPNYGQALGVLATSHAFTAHMGWEDMDTGMAIAERAARAAIRADAEDAWAHNALGHALLFARRFDDCLAEFELSLQLNPSLAIAHGFYGLALSYCGRWEDGVRAARQALRLSPRDPCAAIYCGIDAYAQFVGANYDEAIRLSREALRLKADFVGAHRVLTAAAAMMGQHDTASAALGELRRAQPNISLAWLGERIPFKRDVDREHYLAAFRRAGLE